jgi:hypothetical protein
VLPNAHPGNIQFDAGSPIAIAVFVAVTMLVAVTIAPLANNYFAPVAIIETPRLANVVAANLLAHASDLLRDAELISRAAQAGHSSGIRLTRY